MRLLCAADLHLGRQPSRLGGPARGLADELSTSVAWHRLVDAAIDLEVTAVLLAGDVLDDEHDYFEAFGDLRAGVERLVAAGAAVVAVSGNHDVEVLPRLAQAVPQLVLLGEGGRWETTTLGAPARPVHVVGWSYPARSVTYSPLSTLPAALELLPPAPTIGLLHCDRDQAGSRHAPVTSVELAAAGLDVWLLGHVHRPDVAAGGGYLGSIFAADPGEEGEHGAWLLEVDGEGEVSLSPLPLSPLRFETVAVDVGELDDPAAIGRHITDAVLETHQRLFGEGAPGAVVRAVGCRLRLTGRSDFRAELGARLAQDDPRELFLTLDGVSYFVHDVVLEMLPAIDLAAIAAGSDPLALLARKLLVLDGPPSLEQERLLEEGRTRLEAVAAGRHYRGLEPPSMSEAALADQLRLAALRLIDLMVGP